MDYQKLINTNIKKLRLKNNLTQEEFAEKIGISLNGVSNIERNRYQPTAKVIDKICKTFNLMPAELLLLDTDNNNDLIKNISTLLHSCLNKKLKKIYDIILILLR